MAEAQITPEVRQFLDVQRVGHLATADSTATPHVVPVCYALIGTTVYIALDEKPKRVGPRRLRRVRNVLDNPTAAVVVDRYDEDWSRLAYVLAQGHARLVEPGTDEHAPAVRALRSRYAPYRAMRLEELPLIALDVDRVVHWGPL